MVRAQRHHTVEHARDLMQHKGIHTLAVVDSDGALVGIVSSQDLAADFKDSTPISGGRFFPAGPLKPTPKPGRAYVQGTRLAPTLVELERKLAGLAMQVAAVRWGEMSLLAFDPAKRSAGLVDLSAVADIKLVQLASRSWMPER